MAGPFDKIKDLAEEHGDKLDGVVDKVADLIDEKTGGKHGDKIDSLADKAKDFLGKEGSGASPQVAGRGGTAEPA